MMSDSQDMPAEETSVEEVTQDSEVTQDPSIEENLVKEFLRMMVELKGLEGSSGLPDSIELPDVPEDMSDGFLTIGAEETYDILKRFKLPIISVGSGSGICEQKLEEKGLKIICVDPHSGAFKKEKIIRKPDYEMTIQQFAKENKKYMGKCVLFINWASPSGDDSYDYQAVKLLNPETIVVINGLEGCAGSQPFHDFMMSNGTPTLSSDLEFKEGEYKCCHQTIAPVINSAIQMCALSVMSKKKIDCSIIHSTREEKFYKPVTNFGLASTAPVKKLCEDIVKKYETDKRLKDLAIVARIYLQQRKLAESGPKGEECLIC